ACDWPTLIGDLAIDSGRGGRGLAPEEQNRPDEGNEEQESNLAGHDEESSLKGRVTWGYYYGEFSEVNHKKNFPRVSRDPRGKLLRLWLCPDYSGLPYDCQSLPSGNASCGSIAFPHVAGVIAWYTLRALPSPNPTMMPPDENACNRRGS